MSRPAGECIPVVFPTSATYDENDLAEKDKSKPEHQQSGDEERVVWYRQTINNACGLYGLLHAVSNGGAREYISKSFLMPIRKRSMNVLMSPSPRFSP